MKANFSLIQIAPSWQFLLPQQKSRHCFLFHATAASVRHCTTFIFSHLLSSLRLTGAGKPVRNQFFLYIPVNKGHHLGYIGLNVCFNKLVTALVWAAERELLGFWCHVCLFPRAYLWISSCLLMRGC